MKIKTVLAKILSTTQGDDPPPQVEQHPSGSNVSDHSNSNQKDVENTMATSLKPLTEIDGFVGACLVDSDSGMVLGLEGGGGAMNLEIAAAGNTQVVQAKRKTMKALGLNDKIEDILISLGSQYHVIRPLESNDAVFIYVAMERSKSNLGMARMQIKGFEKDLDLAVA